MSGIYCYSINLYRLYGEAVQRWRWLEYEDIHTKSKPKMSRYESLSHSYSYTCKSTGASVCVNWCECVLHVNWCKCVLFIYYTPKKFGKILHNTSRIEILHDIHYSLKQDHA